MRICISWRCFSILPIVNRVLLLIIDQRGRQNFSNVQNNMLLFKTKDYSYKRPIRVSQHWPADRYTFSIDIFTMFCYLLAYPWTGSQSPEPLVFLQFRFWQSEIEVGKVRMTQELVAGISLRRISVQAFLY